MKCVLIKTVAAFGRTMSLQQLHSLLCSGFHGFLISVVAVDKQQQAMGVQGNGSADVIAGGCGNSSKAVAIDRQVLDVEHAAADTFVRLSGQS